ncbi:MAG: signal peptidase II [Candidatus Obscuribacterales bacterium]|nr:signal peptidase II [Candidatus Obscuribacterales bacterium]
MRPMRIASVALPLVIVFATDHFTKVLANESLAHGRSEPFLPGILQLTLTRNTGVAFGIGQGHALVTTLIGCTIFVCILGWIFWREKSDEPLRPLELSGCGCVLGGALGNIVDRVTHGYVTDFLEFAFISFPVFNVADVMIDVGAGLIIIAALLTSKRNTVGADGAGSS